MSRRQVIMIMGCSAWFFVLLMAPYLMAGAQEGAKDLIRLRMIFFEHSLPLDSELSKFATPPKSAEKPILPQLRQSPLLLGISQELAKQGVQISEQAAAYQILEAIFLKGSVPKKEEVQGWYSGRLFESERPNDAKPTLLAGVDVEAIPGGGPLFGAVFKMLVLTAQPPIDFPDFFDHGQRFEISLRINQEQGTFSLPEFGQREIKFEANSADHRRNNTYELRKFENYLVLKWSWAIDNGRELKEGVRYAYYFKNVTPATPSGR